MIPTLHRFLRSHGPFEGDFELRPGSVVGVGSTRGERLRGKVRLKLFAGPSGTIHIVPTVLTLASPSGRVHLTPEWTSVPTVEFPSTPCGHFDLPVRVQLDGHETRLVLALEAEFSDGDGRLAISGKAKYSDFWDDDCSDCKTSRPSPEVEEKASIELVLFLLLQCRLLAFTGLGSPDPRMVGHRIDSRSAMGSTDFRVFDSDL